MSKKPLRLPLLKMGTYKHPKLGDLKIDQALIDSVVSHTRGYEPYLRYGHNSKGAGLHGAEPQQGLLKKYEQDGDVLYGLFEPRTDLVVEEVETKAYRYGSAELMLNALDQKTGLRVPAVLKGHSLTNEPFIPNLPENQVLEGELLLADSESRSFPVSLLLADYSAEDDQLGVPYCTVCGDSLDIEEKDANCYQNGLCAECLALTDSRRNPEKTMFQKMAGMLQDMRNTVSGLTWRLDDFAYNQSAACSPTSVMFTDEAVAPAESPAPTNDTPQAPPAGASDQENPPAMTPEEIAQLQADLAAAQTAKAAAEQAAADAQAALQAKEAADQAAAEQAAADAAAAQAAADAAAKAAAEQSFEANLTDLAEKKVAAGALPTRVESAIQIIRAHKAATESTTVCLSDGAEPVDFAASVFALLSDNHVDFAQAGSGVDAALADTPAASGSAPNKSPWGSQLAAVRAKREALQKAV